jgi:parallel beta-helix repeat protein
MLSRFPWYALNRGLAMLVFSVASAAFCYSSTVDIHPGQDIPSIVADNPAGTTFLIYPGTYRLNQHIVPKNGDSFIGQTACAPPTNTCPAILTGSTVIGPLAKFNGVNYQVTGQTQQGVVAVPNTTCNPGYLACNLPEDLFFDGVPYRHLYATSLPSIGSGQWWFDYNSHIIYFHDNPAGHVVETSVLDTAFDSSANDVTMRYLTIKEFAAPMAHGGVEATAGTPTSDSSVNWVIENCDLYDNHGAGVRVAFGMHILNSYLHDNGALGIAGGTESYAVSGVVIEGNTINHNNYAQMLPAVGAGGFKVGYTDGLILRGNTISGNNGAGVHFDAASSDPLVDGNTVTNNSGGSGIGYEISVNSAVMRNNVSFNNGLPGIVPASTSNLGSYASTGVNMYCNTIQVPNASEANGMLVVASNRGYNFVSPFQYLKSTGNTFHHNTVFWAEGAIGVVGYFQHDSVHQPDFFADNPAPDYNDYHIPSLSEPNFIYDNNNSDDNYRKTFTEYQASGADIHGKADTNTSSGFPTVKITSPADQSSFNNAVTVEATASDKSGINRVEFYVDWQLKSTVAGAPYSFDLTGAPVGTHIVTAMAYSDAGIRSCYAVTLTRK